VIRCRADLVRFSSGPEDEPDPCASESRFRRVRAFPCGFHMQLHICTVHFSANVWWKLSVEGARWGAGCAWCAHAFSAQLIFYVFFIGMVGLVAFISQASCFFLYMYACLYVLDDSSIVFQHCILAFFCLCCSAMFSHTLCSLIISCTPIYALLHNGLFISVMFWQP
jgi:hypothetical protein